MKVEINKVELQLTQLVNTVIAEGCKRRRTSERRDASKTSQSARKHTEAGDRRDSATARKRCSSGRHSGIDKHDNSWRK